jgi:methylase of polypeptide subunit release factors
MTMALRTEADVVATLEAGTYPLPALYGVVAAEADVARDRGHDRVQDGQPRWQRRVRCALQHAKRTGRARQAGRGVWAITDGTVGRPVRALLVLLTAAPTQLELALVDAATLLGRVEEQVSLVLADPPWALDRGQPGGVDQRVYVRDHQRVVGGYEDVSPAEYAEFTQRWVRAAAAALRPGGYLAAITGPQQAARVQVAAADAGLSYVNAVVVRRPFALRSTRRFAHAHLVVSLLAVGPPDSPLRYFASPPDLPKARSGRDYPLDWWPDIPKYERAGLLRYDNALHPRLVRRIVLATTRPTEQTPDGLGELVADPFVGSGTAALVCLQEGRRFVGGDVNPAALRFTMARLLAEHLWTPRQLTLNVTADVTPQR